MRFALIGDPVASSVSPAMHGAAFRALGLPHEYSAERVPDGALDDAFASLRERYDGLNVTIPQKTAVIRHLDELTPVARAAGSVNTVIFRAGTALGDSTDGAGALKALRRGVPGRELGSALVVGAGGAARAVASALVRAEIRTAVFARDAAAAKALAGDIAGLEAVGPTGLAETLLRGCDLLVSAVPAAAWEDPAPVLPLDLALAPGRVVFDLVYRPRRTALLRAAEAVGCATVEGVEMLIEQGALSLALWLGIEAPIEVMRAAAYGALTEPVRA